MGLNGGNPFPRCAVPIPVRRFLVVGHRAATTPDFPLDDLTGSAGRMDLMLNAVTAGLLLSHDVRRDTEVSLLLLGPPSPPRAIRFVGGEVAMLNPDVRSNAALVRRALKEPSRLERPVSPGVYASKRALEEILEAMPVPPVLLTEKGDDLRKVSLPVDALFILSDTVDLTPEEDRTVAARGALRVSLGPRSVHTDHAISVLHNELDRREARS